VFIVARVTSQPGTDVTNRAQISSLTPNVPGSSPVVIAATNNTVQSSGLLPVSGSTISGILAVGAGLLLIGGALRLARRRRVIA
jgi:LPXTG-motif cell wall-anchored protein